MLFNNHEKDHDIRFTQSYFSELCDLKQPNLLRRKTSKVRVKDGLCRHLYLSKILWNTMLQGDLCGVSLSGFANRFRVCQNGKTRKSKQRKYKNDACRVSGKKHDAC